MEVDQLKSTLERVKEQMEYESQVKLQKLIEQHRAELGKHNVEIN